jgi:hypothetical protein
MTNGHHMNKSESPSPKDDLGQVWLKLAQWFWRRRFFCIFSVFLHFCYYLPLKVTNGHHMNKSESPSPKDDLGQVWLKLAQWFWRRRFFCIFQCIFTFSLLSPLEMTNGHHMNKSESPSPKDDLGQVWLKLAQWFWRRRFFCILVYFYIFAIISP